MLYCIENNNYKMVRGQNIMRFTLWFICFFVASNALAQSTNSDWAQLEAETLEHYRALLQFDTSDPPGRELPAAEYLRDVLASEGIDVEMLATDPARPNVLARINGNGKKQPLLLMAHTDVVNVDPEKWTFPPFSATVDGGYVYGRGAVDDKDNLASALMVMLELKLLQKI